MISGRVTENGVPIILIVIRGRTWPATLDTGFNGDLELPNALRGDVNARHIGEVSSFLAGGQMINEYAYHVDFPFDGEKVLATATFVDEPMILIGTRLLREYQLRIGFVSRTVELERE